MSNRFDAAIVSILTQAITNMAKSESQLAKKMIGDPS